MLANLFHSLSLYVEAFQAMSKHRLWAYALLPGFISLALAAGLISWLVGYAGDISLWIMGIYPWEWAKETITTVLAWLSGGLMVLGGLVMFRYLLMVVASPFMGMLSEKLEEAMTGRPAAEFSAGQLITDIVRGLRIAIRNIFREIGFTLLVLILGFVIPGPGNAIAAAITLVIQAYYAGFGNVDYTLERKRFSVQQSVEFVRNNRGMVLGNGAGWLLLMLIPVLGWFLAPVLGTAAATRSVLEKLDQRSYSLLGNTGK